ncbi:uncharacterized protein C19orf44-like isoform X2 [Mytilus californianus]|uniref:uncharacterized protein C19orf44-like isoform X2 n=1 Tax=Mytilus californianus TaxID=6549 RepID=UPI002246C53B|nr:uncharacterized protein C19orf44-like isoform X2 [Mytilus californianus]
MKRSGSSTNALLEKVSSQLKGERVKKKDDEDEALNAYIKSLSQKTAQQRGKSVDFEEMGDISISSELDTHDTSSSMKRRALTTSGSKFLKKKITGDSASQPMSKFLRKPQVSSASPVPTVSEQIRGHIDQKSVQKPGQRSVQKSGQMSVQGQRSAALEKASVLAKKITQRSNENRKVFTLETDSESLETPRQITESDSFKIGKNSGKFLKKKPESTEPVVISNRPSSPKPQQQAQKAKGSPFKLKSSQKYSTDVVLSSGEESLQEFIFADGSDDSGRMVVKGGTITRQEFRKRSQSPHRSMSPDSKPPTPSSRTPRRSPSPKIGRRSPSPGLRRSRSLSEDTVASDIIEEVNESDPLSASSEDVFRVNLMDADTLEPVIIAKPNISERKSRNVSKKKVVNKNKREEKKKKKKEKKNEDIFSALGLHTVEELLGDIQDLDEPKSEVSEIKTQSESEEIKTERSDQMLGGHKLKDSRSEVIVSEIKTRSSTPKYSSYSEDFDSSISEHIGESVKKTKMKSVSEIKTQYSDEDETEDISERLSSDSESLMTESRATPTSDRTITDSYTYSDRPAPRRDRVKTHTVEVQTSEPGLQYQWDSKYSGFAVPGFLTGLGMVDPTPIATHVVSPDALEAMTAYSPAMLALHDMLKQQLDLTKQFIQSQKYLYKSFTDSMETTHKYTTLEDTRQYIKKHRPKTLTFKEAMKMVKSEMRR